jgi:hypothetical protein
MVVTVWRFGKELLFFCSIGALIGAGICFLMFLHLGTPKAPEEVGYITGLFVKSGAQLGFIFWMVRASARLLRRWFSTDREKSTEKTRFPDGKIASDGIDSNRKQRRFAALAKPWD